MTHRGALTFCGMGCSDSRICSGGLCSRQAAGVLGLDLHSELLCRHKIVGHCRRVAGWFFVERHARLLFVLVMMSATPKIADDTSGAATEFEVHLCRPLDYGKRVELVQLGVQQRRLDAVNIAWQPAHDEALSAAPRAHARTEGRPARPPVSMPFEGGRRQDLRFGPNEHRRETFDDERNLKLDSSSLSYDFLPVCSFHRTPAAP